MIKKWDVILGFFLLLLCAGSFLLLGQIGENGQVVTITVNGALCGTYDLSQDQTIHIEQPASNGSAAPENIVEIKDGAVQMTESTCHNQICVEQGKINRTNQAIVCLPNRVIVTLAGENSEMDAFSH